MKYIIRTPYGSRFVLNNKGQVTEYSNGFRSPGDDGWKVLGIVELKPFGRVGPLIPLADAIKIKDFCFKNGKPRYTALDMDHGTPRLWGNTRYHGVCELYAEKAGQP